MKSPSSHERKELRAILTFGGIATATLLIVSWPFLYRVVIEPILLHRNRSVVLYDGPLVPHAPLPVLRITDARGQTQELPQIIVGKPAVIFFFASWCESCGATLRDLNTLRQSYEKSGVKTIAVHVSSTEHIDRALELIANAEFPGQYLFFENDPAAEKRYLGSDRLFPMVIFADAGGKVTGILKGIITLTALDQGLRGALGESLRP